MYINLSINRNIVECKVIYANRNSFTIRSINRNIVECKDYIENRNDLLNQCINRNIVECKELHQENAASCQLVLIETLWNVKTKVHRSE